LGETGDGRLYEYGTPLEWEFHEPRGYIWGEAGFLVVRDHPPSPKLARLWGYLGAGDDAVHRFTKLPGRLFWSEYAKIELYLLRHRKQSKRKIATAVSDFATAVSDFFLFLHRISSGATYDMQSQTFGDPRPELNLEQTYFCRAFHRVATAMQAYLPDKLSMPIGRVIDANRNAAFPITLGGKRCYLGIDGTHAQIDRPYQPAGMVFSTWWPLQKLYYDYKHHCFSLKILVCCDVQARIVFISRVYTGATHDMKVFKECGILDWAKLNGQELVFLADKGYISRQFADRIIAPIKQPGRIRGRPRRHLSAEDVQRNRLINSERVRVEHLNGKAKEMFRALSTGNMEGNRDLMATVFLSGMYFAMVYSWEVRHESH
jgi:hypothetical protein